MSDISEEDLKYLTENADRIVPYIPPGYFARINAKAKADRERKKNEEEEEEENEKKKSDEEENDEEENDEEENHEEENDEEENEKNEGWGGYPNEGLPIIFHLSHFDSDKDGNLVPRVGPKTLAMYYDEETGDYVGEVVAKVEPQEVEEQEARQQKTKEQTKQPSSQSAPERKPRTNLSLPKPIPAFPGYKNPDLRNEDWGLPLDQVDIKVRHNISLGSNQGDLLLRKAQIEYPSLSKVQARRYRQVMRSREMGEWHRSQYKLALKGRKKAWKKASRRLKEGRGVVMTEVVQEPYQLEI